MLLLLLTVACSEGVRQAGQTPVTATVAAPTSTTPTPTETQERPPTASPTTTATPGASPTPVGDDLDPQTRAFVDEVAQRTSDLRGLPVPEDLPVRIIRRDQLRETLDSLYRPQDLEDLADLTLLYRLLSFIENDDDLYSVYQEFTEGAVAGFYVPDQDQLYVVQDASEFSASDESTLAHEWTHAIQDAAFDLTSAFDAAAPGDPELALTALVEGDAVLTQFAYMNEFVEGGLASLFDEDALGALTDSLQVLLSTPEPIQREQYFPYEAGPEFLRTVTMSGELTVDEVFARPPSTTAEILHPQLYIEGWRPVEVSMPYLELGADWQITLETSLGEFQLQNWLLTQVDAAAAREASAGWNGDSLTVYESSAGQTLAILVVAWATLEDEQQMASVLGEIQQSSDTNPEGAWAGEDGDFTYYQDQEEGLAIVWTNSEEALARASAVLAP